MLAFLGDIHGDYDVLRKAAARAKEAGAVAMIQVGDMGIFPHNLEAFAIQEYDLPIYFIDGNHEHFEYFAGKDEVYEIFPNVFYVPRGTLLNLDGKDILFFGGAASIDVKIRKRENLPWDARENITEADLQKAARYDKCDLFVVHCPPQSIIDNNFDPMFKLRFEVGLEWQDPNAAIIEQEWNRLGKPFLICGHMHRNIKTTEFHMVDINTLMIRD